MDNIDLKTVSGFGDEWSRFNQSLLSSFELNALFKRYFQIFPWESLPEEPVGFDLGCGSGRWAKLVSKRVTRLHCIDASEKALTVAKNNLEENENCSFHLASVDNIPLEDNSMDFGYSLGVLHHVPDTISGIKSCVEKLKPGAPLLIYLYYAFDNRPAWYRAIWKFSNIFRLIISKLPYHLRYLISQIIATIIYYPLARFSLVLEKIGINIESIPLSDYRNLSFYTMRTDARDRIGTRLEKRFNAKEIKEMMEISGLENIMFSDIAPYWCALGYKCIVK